LRFGGLNGWFLSVYNFFFFVGLGSISV
jgi:hypothetical protein